MSGFQVVLIVAFALSCAYTIFGYPGRYGALSGRQRLFRTVGLFLLNLFLGLVLLGTFLDFQQNTPPRIAALRFLTYWMAVLFLFFSLLCIALLDWLESLVAYRRAQSDFIRQMGREEREARESARREEDAEREDGTGPDGE